MMRLFQKLSALVNTIITTAMLNAFVEIDELKQQASNLLGNVLKHIWWCKTFHKLEQFPGSLY